MKSLVNTAMGRWRIERVKELYTIEEDIQLNRAGFTPSNPYMQALAYAHARRP